MKLTALLVVLLAAAAPSSAQSRLYTNADLGRHLQETRPSPAAAAAILAPYQFVYVAPDAPAWGPTFVIIGGSPSDGPFGAFGPYPPPTSPYWSMEAYVGSSSYGHGSYGHSPSRSAAPVVTIGVPPPPQFRTAGAWRGHSR
jgi:hypothetical protein